MSDEKYGETRLQVITDIDDTVKSSGGLRLLGKLGVNIGPLLLAISSHTDTSVCSCVGQDSRHADRTVPVTLASDTRE